MEELNKIEHYVNTNLNVEINQISRKRPIVDGRFLFFALARKCTELSFEKIGGYLNRDHATAIHAVQMFQKVLEPKNKYKELYDGYVLEYLTRKVLETETEEEPKELLELREIKTKEFNGLRNKIELLERKITLLEKENIVLKLKVKDNEPFLADYYDLEEQEQQIVKDRVKLIIRMLPSKQKRKEVFEIINCSQ